MSLINQMLQDLESRAKPAPGGGAALNDLIWPGGQTDSARASSLLEQIMRSPVLRLAALVGASVLAAVIIWAAWRIFAPQPTTQPVAQVQTPAPTPAPGPAAPEAAPAMSTPAEADTSASAPAPVTAAADTETPVAAVAPEPPAPASPPDSAVTPIQAPEPELTKGDRLATQDTGNTQQAATPPQPARSVKKQRPLSVAEQAEQAYQDGIQLSQQGKPEAAESRLRQALTLDAHHLKAREALADALLKRAQPQEAETVLAEGIRLDPEYLLFTKLYARVLVDQGDAPAALAALEDKAAGATQDIEYQAFLAALYQRLQRHNDAISAYRKTLASQPQQGVWWMGLGISLEATQQPAEALEAYRHAQATGRLTPAVLDFVKGRISTLKAQVSG